MGGCIKSAEQELCQLLLGASLSGLQVGDYPLPYEAGRYRQRNTSRVGREVARRVTATDRGQSMRPLMFGGGMRLVHLMIRV